MSTGYSDSLLRIDLEALAANYHLLDKKSDPAECASVVKANAYGLGVRQVALKLEKTGCKKFFVATLDEGVELRSILPNVEIYIFHGFQSGQENIVHEHNIIPVLNDFYQISDWNSLGINKDSKLPAIIHIDTGMNRLGLNFSDAEKLVSNKDDIGAINIKYIMSHLACSGEGHPKNNEQLQKFDEVRNLFPGTPATLANSSGIFLGKDFCHDLVRPGIALYGSNPTPGNDNPMGNVVTLKAKIIQVRDITSSQTAGYGATKEISSGSQLATVPIGYADGYLRHLGNKGLCYIDEYEVPVVGRISMDLIIIDITEIPEKHVKIGTEVELIGRHVPVDLVAKQAGTIGYEILTSLGARCRREYVGIGE